VQLAEIALGPDAQCERAVALPGGTRLDGGSSPAHRRRRGRRRAIGGRGEAAGNGPGDAASDRGGRGTSCRAAARSGRRREGQGGGR
jgi:hypothetical protein